jgi:preprotein translocase subunit YajC
MVRRITRQPGANMFISPAFAQTTAAAGSSGSLSSILQFAPLVLIFIVFYFLLIRPQQTQQKKLKERLSSIKRGDRVVTAGGIIGLVKKAADGANEVEVEIAPNVTVAVVRSTITTVLTTEAANDKK